MNKITFLPDNVVIETDCETSLSELAVRAGITLNNSCGGQGTCGKCKVIMREGKTYSPPQKMLTPEEIKKGYVMACQTFPRSDLTVEVPDKSRLEKIKVSENLTVHFPKAQKIPVSVNRNISPVINKNYYDLKERSKNIASPLGFWIKLNEYKKELGEGGIDFEKLPIISGNDFGKLQKAGFQFTLSEYINNYSYEICGLNDFILPGIKKDENILVELKLPLPTIELNLADAERILTALEEKNIKKVKFNYEVLKKLPHLIRENEFQVKVLLVKNENKNTEILGYEIGNKSDIAYGLAIDIGTTTLECHLVDLLTGATLRVSSAHNPQISYGEDVITRIIFSETPDGLGKLNEALVNTLNGLILSLTEECLKEPVVRRTDINQIFISGNTTMEHIFYNLSPKYIRRKPYIPVSMNIPPVPAMELGLRISDKGYVFSIPNPACYVGGDIVAGIIASGIYSAPRISALIDLGTNGEIAIGNEEFIFSSSTSCGPCFEGGGIKFGMRAKPEAIEKVKITGKNMGILLPDKEARSKEAFMVNYFTIEKGLKPEGLCGSGIISVFGELIRNKIIDRSGKIILNANAQVKETSEGKEFIIVPAKFTAIGEDITITENDIKNLINSKAAIYAGFMTMLKKMEIKMESISKIYIAGGLGNSLDIDAAILLGMLPDLKEKFVFIGNSAIAGTVQCLLSEDIYLLSKEIASKMLYLDLSGATNYMDEFIASLFLPHTDIELFKSVREYYE